MPTKRYTPKRETDLFDSGKLPTDKPIAIYYRQSTEKQVGNVSTERQTVDLPQYVIRLGWQPESVILIDDDAGISGKKSIDQRPGMSRLYDMILKREIGAVCCIEVSRLFRDEFGIEPGKFARACRDSEVVVIVPYDDPYIFHHPTRGKRHTDRFLEDCKEAADELWKKISRRMHGAIKYQTEQGLWAGGNLTPGYMVDARDKHHRVYVPFEPCAKAVREYFRLFFQCNKNVRATALHIARFGPDYPFDDPEVIAQVPEDHIWRKPNNLKPKNGRYYPGVGALNTLLTNVAYIGHWAVNGVIVKRDNHPPIVDKELFQAAFNAVSSTTLTGEPNPDHVDKSGGKAPRTRNHDGNESAIRPYLEGLLYHADNDGQERPINTVWEPCGKEKTEFCYYYLATRCHGGFTDKLWRKQAAIIDKTAHEAARLGMITMLYEDEINNQVDPIEPNYEVERKRTKDLLDKNIRDAQALIDTIAPGDPPEYIADVKRRHAAYIADRKRLEQKLETIDAAEKDQQLRTNVSENLQDWYESYDEKTPEQKRAILEIIFKKVVARVDRDDLILTYYGNNGYFIHESTVPKNGNRGWTNAKTARLLELVAQGADQETIAEEFKDRTWKSINDRHIKVTGKRIKVRPHPIHDDETFEDYQRREFGYPGPESDDTTFGGIMDPSHCRAESRSAVRIAGWATGA